jgi:hypothetical protein
MMAARNPCEMGCIDGRKVIRIDHRMESVAQKRWKDGVVMDKMVLGSIDR